MPPPDVSRRLAALAVLALSFLAAVLGPGCGGAPIPVFLSPDSGEIPQAPDVKVEVSAEGAPSGSELSLFVGTVRVTSQPGADRLTYLWDTRDLSGPVTLWAEVRTPSGDRGEASMDVTVTAGETEPPGIAFVWPIEGQAVLGTTLVEVEATGERAAEVESVSLELDGAPLAEDTQPEFLITWDTTVVTEGAHTLRAVGRYGNQFTEPASVTVDVSNADEAIVIIITSPSDGAIVSGTVAVKAAIEHINPIARVDFAIGDESNVEHSTTVAPWQWTWNTTDLSPGEFGVYVTAFDEVGNTATASIAVTVDPTTAEPLSVTILEPEDGAVVTEDVAVKCELTWIEEVRQLDFYLDGVLVKSMATGPWQWAWPVTSMLESGELAPGEHVVEAIVTDVAEGEASDEINVTVEAG